MPESQQFHSIGGIAVAAISGGCRFAASRMATLIKIYSNALSTMVFHLFCSVAIITDDDIGLGRRFLRGVLRNL